MVWWSQCSPYKCVFWCESFARVLNQKNCENLSHFLLLKEKKIQVEWCEDAHTSLARREEFFFPTLDPFSIVIFAYAFVFVKGKFCLWNIVVLTLVSLFSSIRCVHIHLWSWNWELLWSHSWDLLWPQDSGECMGRYTQYILTNCPSLERFCSWILKTGKHRTVERLRVFLSLSPLTCVKGIHVPKYQLNESLGIH